MLGVRRQLLAAIGSYGVLSYMVTEGRREIGIRMALGADRASVMRIVLSQGLTLFGILARLSAAFALSRVLGSLLFGVTPTDPLTIAAVVALNSGGAGRLLPDGPRATRCWCCARNSRLLLLRFGFTRPAHVPQ